MKILSLDHVSLQVADVETSIDFYENKIGLRPLERPLFDFAGAWFELPDGRQLHLIGGRTEPLRSAGSRGDHFALRVESAQRAADHLKERSVVFKGPKARPDGAIQVFAIDPDGHCIEFFEC